MPLQSQLRNPARTYWLRWMTVLTAMAVAVAVWTAAVPLLGIALRVDMGGPVREVNQLAVVLTLLLSGLAGWASLSLLERLTARARPIWTALAVAVLLVSLAGPFAATTAAATGVLVVLHVVVAAILVVGLPRAGRQPSGAA